MMRYLILLFASLLFSAELIIQFPNLKKEYYQNQIIDLQVKVITPREMKLTFIPPANAHINIKKENRFVYIVDIKYINDNKRKYLIIKGPGTYKKVRLDTMYTSLPLEKINNFSNILAKKIGIENLIASKYDDKYNMISFTLKTEDANLKDFSLHLKDENLTIISPDKATYFGLVDKKKHIVSFYYFNTDKNNYEKITLPVNIKQETISTQTELNPEEDTLFTPLNIFILSLIAVFTLIFIIYKKIWLLIPPVVTTAFLIYFNLPKGEAVLNKGTHVYILPTKNSTVFYTVPSSINVKILKHSKRYSKVKIENKIGWVKNEDLK